MANGILHELLNYNQCDTGRGVNRSFVLFVTVTAPLDSLVNNWSDAPIIDQNPTQLCKIAQLHLLQNGPSIIDRVHVRK